MIVMTVAAPDEAGGRVAADPDRKLTLNLPAGVVRQLRAAWRARRRRCAPSSSRPCRRGLCRAGGRDPRPPPARPRRRGRLGTTFTKAQASAAMTEKQVDLFLDSIVNAPMKDDRALMEFPFFSLQKAPRLRPLVYDDGKVKIEVRPGRQGASPRSGTRTS